MAVDKDAWERKAEAAWEEFEGEDTAGQVNLKSLVSDVKAALQKKKAANTKVSKKAKANAAKKAKAARVTSAIVEAATKAPDPAEERRKLAALNYQISVTKAIGELRASIDLAVSNLDTIQVDTVKALGLQLKAVQGSIKSAPIGVDRDSLLGSISTVGIEIGQLAVVANDHKKVAADKLKQERTAVHLARQQAAKKLQKPAEPAKRPGFLDSFRKERTKLDTQQEFIGPRNRNSFLRNIDKVRELLGSAPSRIASAAGTQVGRAANYIQSPNSPVLVRALNSIAKGTVATGRAVQQAGKDSMSWLGKRMSSLSRMFSRFFSGGGVSEGFGMLGKLLGGGVFLGAVLKPILDGIDGELSKRFGDSYVQDFITGLWTKAWGYLVGQIKGFLGITEASNPIGQAGDAHDVSAESKSIMDAATPAQPLTKEQTVAKEKALEAYRAELDKGSFLQKYYQIGLTPTQKAAKERYEASLKGELNVNATTSSTTSASSSTTATSAPASTSSSSSSSTATPTATGRSSPVSTASPGPATVKASPVTPPMEGPKSVPAPAPRAAPVPTQTGSAAPPSNPSTGSLGAGQVPTYASSESLHLMSIGVFG